MNGNSGNRKRANSPEQKRLYAYLAGALITIAVASLAALMLFFSTFASALFPE